MEDRETLIRPTDPEREDRIRTADPDQLTRSLTTDAATAFVLAAAGTAGGKAGLDTYDAAKQALKTLGGKKETKDG